MVAVTSPAAGKKNETAATPADTEANRELMEFDASDTGSAEGAAGKNKDASWASSDSTVFSTEEAVLVVAPGAAAVFAAVDR